MTAVPDTTVPGTVPPEARRALRATELLGVFNEAGVLHAADVHVAERLGAVAGEDDPQVLLAAAFTVRSTRQGSVMFPLADARQTAAPVDDPAGGTAAAALPWPDPEEWRSAVAASVLVATTDDVRAPLRMADGALWLDRYWQQEVAVAEGLRRRAADLPDVDVHRLHEVLHRFWPEAGPDDQRLAAAVCALSRVSVLAGGPGTGKTTTVARLLAVFRELAAPGPAPRIALAAPTGKAAARMKEAMQEAADGDEHLGDDDRALLRGMSASTLHRLLRMGHRNTRYAPGPDNPLPIDVLVVDEASMISLTLFARLLAALPQRARLVVVGDPDQLAAVEAGAVLADLTEDADGSRTASRSALLGAAVPLDVAGYATVAADAPGAQVRDGIARLRRVHRFSGPIAALAEAIRAGEPTEVLGVLRAGHPEVRFSEVEDDGPLAGSALTELRTAVVDHAWAVIAAARRGDSAAALRALERQRLMCAHRNGPRGVAHWQRLIERWIGESVPEGQQPVVARRDGRYAGMPLLVLANDYDNDLFNGDTGVVVARRGELVAAFGSPDQPLEVPLGRLGSVAPMRALTVHRSQGSQFGEVTVVLPPSSSPLATRQMLYTAVTRTQRQVTVVGSEAAVSGSVARRAARATGLRRRLAAADAGQGW